MADPSNSLSLLPEERSIINALIYFDLFDHPLSQEELAGLTRNIRSDKRCFIRHLGNLCSTGLIREKDHYYFLEGKEWTVEKRINEEKRVEKFFRIARLAGHIVAAFPYVRGILVSGSLSKRRAGRDGDIDFLVITEKGKLWISRTLLMLFKKIFLLNSHKYFCLNYFVDVDSLEISNRDRFTATEICTLMPVYNRGLYDRFLRENGWIMEYYPHIPDQSNDLVLRRNVHILKWIIECALRNRLGDLLDDYLMKKTLEYRRRKFSNLDDEAFSQSFDTRKNSSTHFPNDFRLKVISEFRTSQKSFENQHQIYLGQYAESTAIL